jgi:UDP-N-acetyl-D-mannosaminuronic acid transferase (WecB/TagA/CpsF family)
MQKILKIRIDKISPEQAVRNILQWSQGDVKKMVTTPNPEIVLPLRKIINFCEF